MLEGKPLRTYDTALLSRGSQVRVLPGAPFPKEFADFARKKNRRRSFIEQSDRSGECAPHSSEFEIGDSPSNSRRTESSSIYAIRESDDDLRSWRPEVALRRAPAMAW